MKLAHLKFHLWIISFLLVVLASPRFNNLPFWLLLIFLVYQFHNFFSLLGVIRRKWFTKKEEVVVS